LVQGNARQGPPTLWHQCQLVQNPLPLELNRRLVAKSRHSEVFSAVNASVGPPHCFVISSNLTTINTSAIGSALTLHRQFHLSPLDPLARKREGSAEGATCSVAQSKRGWSRCHPTSPHTGHPPYGIRHLPSAIRHLASAICHTPLQVPRPGIGFVLHKEDRINKTLIL